MNHVQAEVPNDTPIAPLTRIAFNYWFLIHAPLVTVAIIIALDFAGKIKSQEAWLFCMFGCFTAFVLVSGLWLLGATLPFWTIPARG
jgi:hypothetical protein